MPGDLVAAPGMRRREFGAVVENAGVEQHRRRQPEFVEKVGLLRRDLQHKGDLERYQARFARIDQKFSALAEMISRADPEFAKAVDPALVARHRSGTVDEPFGPIVARGVINAAECRPWAAAAAGARPRRSAPRRRSACRGR